LLYGLIILALAGVLFANPEIKMTTDVQFKVDDLGYLFPVLFVTIACGAISGFHSLVASGTTSKQINKESDAKIVGYGGMLIESFLAIVAICSVIILSQQEYSSRLLAEGPVSLFASGLGGIISSLGLPADLTVTFVALAVSSFALTTLDTCTRLGRFVVQEYCEEGSATPSRILSKNRYLATTLVIILSMLLLASGSFTTLWPIFGSANQLLAALALLAISLWLIKNKTRALFVLIPTCFMFAVTLTSLFLFALSNFSKGAYVLCIISTLLFMLSVTVIWLAIKSLRSEEVLESSPQ
jgi:carbon starvation protein